MIIFDSTKIWTFNLFHSRRIGLQDGEQIPIDYGARLTGKIAGTELGYLNMSTNQKNDILKTTSLITFLAVFTALKPYTSKKNINIARVTKDKIENF